MKKRARLLISKMEQAPRKRLRKIYLHERKTSYPIKHRISSKRKVFEFV